MQREMAEVYCGCSVSCKAGKEQEMLFLPIQVGRRKITVGIVYHSSSLG